ncbi:MAG: response regulator [Desulfobacteraceae bacterium]|nr:response regulator [Desulfobacteraceae bacterium]
MRQRHTIIVVDNSEAVRELISFTLEEEGYNTVKAEDGCDALTKMNDTKADMMFTDLNMPNMDGIELVRQVRARPGYKFLPIIIVTTVSDPSVKQQAKTAGATAWITKPFKGEQLLRVVKKVLR